MKICKVIWSTNRLQYLIRTLDSFKKNLSFGDHEVYGIFIDDYPKDRDDELIRTIAQHYGYDKVVLHQENIGLTATWTETNKILNEIKCDYIWHQEDDVELLYPLEIDTCIDLLKSDDMLSQVSMKRQAWYWGELENPVTVEPDDVEFGNYRYNRKQEHFWTMSSCYPYYISQFPYKEMSGFDTSEGIVMSCLKQYYNLYSAVLKTDQGTEIVNHIGQVTQGKRISKEGDPSYDFFSWMDPLKRYDSRSGREIGNDEHL